MTIRRYYTIVAALYFAVFLAIAVVVGPLSLRLWSLPFVGAGVGVFVTWVAMARFGNAGGSIYFTPTVIHAGMVMILLVAFAVGMPP